MIESNKCTKCKYVYELTWDDEGDKYYNNHDDDLDEDYDDDLYPEYCPFCGLHKNYCDEEDSSDIF